MEEVAGVGDLDVGRALREVGVDAGGDVDADAAVVRTVQVQGRLRRCCSSGLFPVGEIR